MVVNGWRWQVRNCCDWRQRARQTETDRDRWRRAEPNGAVHLPFSLSYSLKRTERGRERQREKPPAASAKALPYPLSSISRSMTRSEENGQIADDWQADWADLHSVSSSSGQFNSAKLNWYNSHFCVCKKKRAKLMAKAWALAFLAGW